MAAIVTVPAPIGYVSYNSFGMQLLRVEEWDFKNRRDNADIDYCLADVVVGLRCHWNPAATATASNPQPPFAGDRVGVSLFNSWTQIFQDRKTLIVQIGNDVVLQAPESNQFLSDAENGPKLLDFRILEVHGVKSAVVFLRFSCVVGGNQGIGVKASSNNVVLSNRWQTQAVVDEDWFTTITTHGRMKVRTDILALQPTLLTPDVFRGACLPPVLDGFRRYPINVIATDDGTELMWECVDRQMGLQLPTDCPATTLEGSVTVGSDLPYRGPLSKAIREGLALISPIFWEGVFPTPKNQFILRAKGPPGTNKAALLSLCTNVALDRINIGGGLLAGLFGKKGSPVFVSFYATAMIHEPAVQLTGEFMGTAGQIVKGAVVGITQLISGLNLTSAVTTGGNGGQLVDQPPFGNRITNKSPPNDGNSRGQYIGILLQQALKGDFSAPLPNVQSYDLPLNKTQPFQ